MKLAFTLFAVLICSTISAQSLNKMDRSAEWHYFYEADRGSGFHHILYTGDTTIRGRYCQKLVTTAYNFIPDGQQGWQLQNYSPSPDRFVSFSGDTMFRLINGEFKVMYNFGAKKGDSWDPGRSNGGPKCNHLYITVESNGDTLIDGKTRRWIRIADDALTGFLFDGMIVEGIGPIDANIFPVEAAQRCDTNLTFKFPKWGLRCFKSDSMALKIFTAKECDYPLQPGSIGKTQPLDFTIYPNPASSEISFSLPWYELSEVQLFDMRGELLLSKSMNGSNARLPVDKLKPGLYLIRGKSESNKNASGTFMKVDARF